MVVGAISLSGNSLLANPHANHRNHGWGQASDNGDNNASDRGNQMGVGHQTPQGDVKAPLDGGLISILLGGLGVAYYSRKKKLNK